MMQDQIALDFERDGFVVVKGLYTPQEMNAWKQRVLDCIDHEGGQNDPSGVRVWMADHLDPFFRNALTDSRIASILKNLVGPSIEFLSVKPVFKNHSVTFGSPWHHDWAYWEGSHKLSIWIALDKARRSNGCLKMIPGSHKTCVQMKSVSETTGFANRIDDKDIDPNSVRVLEADQGDVVVFHDLTLHASFPNSDGLDRWAFIATYRDGSTPDESTVWTHSLLVP